jgi:hypothetical protein
MDTEAGGSPGRFVSIDTFGLQDFLDAFMKHKDDEKKRNNYIEKINEIVKKAFVEPDEEKPHVKNLKDKQADIMNLYSGKEDGEGTLKDVQYGKYIQFLSQILSNATPNKEQAADVGVVSPGGNPELPPGGNPALSPVLPKGDVNEEVGEASPKGPKESSEEEVGQNASSKTDVDTLVSANKNLPNRDNFADGKDHNSTPGDHNSTPGINKKPSSTGHYGHSGATTVNPSKANHSISRGPSVGNHTTTETPTSQTPPKPRPVRPQLPKPTPAPEPKLEPALIPTPIRQQLPPPTPSISQVSDETPIKKTEGIGAANRSFHETGKNHQSTPGINTKASEKTHIGHSGATTSNASKANHSITKAASKTNFEGGPVTPKGANLQTHANRWDSKTTGMSLDNHKVSKSPSRSNHEVSSKGGNRTQRYQSKKKNFTRRHDFR